MNTTYGNEYMEEVQVNGSKFAWSQVIPVLMFTFWLGGLSLTVAVNADDQKEHSSLPAHGAAALATNTIESNVEHNKEELEEVKVEVAKVNEKLDELEKQMATDKDEIIRAIRESE